MKLVNLTTLDGARQSLSVKDGRIAETAGGPTIDLQGRLVTPGLLDVQVNGGGGVMLGDCADLVDLGRLATAQMASGTTHILPTLISDSGEAIARAVDLVAEAQAGGLWQVAGLHLEGPHIAIAGAHDPEMLRPMSDADLESYLAARARLGTLMLTLAPEVVSVEQIARLARGGVTVSLGHTGCDYDMARAAFAAGARGVTHLWNAMSGLHHRAPGLVGAALDTEVYFGLIADGVHVHPAALRLAWRLARDRIVPVSDAMAVAGTRLPGFTLHGREIARKDGRLTLKDGTLAGADLTLADGIARLASESGAGYAQVLQTALTTPWALIGRPAPVLDAGAPAVFVVWDGPGAAPFVHTQDGWWQDRAPW